MQLAQLNIAQAIAPIDSPELADFVAQLDAVNQLADASPGFVWRLQDESGDATGIKAFDNDSMIVNMSVWESIEALQTYVYSDGHLAVLKDKARWFEKICSAHLVLWWVPDGHIPSLDEAKAKLQVLNEYGPTPDAFTFSKPFNPNNS